MDCQKGSKRFVRKVVLVIVLLFSVGYAYPPLPEPRTEEEACFTRRIVNFWRDKEYDFTKAQINAYLVRYPSSPFAGHFYAMLGDMALHEKAYKKALSFYDHIMEAQLLVHVESKRWHALYQLEWYEELYAHAEGFYKAEAAFRLGLNEEALALYTDLETDELFAPHVKLAMAEIYRLLNRPQEAATLYLEIANSSDDPAEVRFHAAVLLAQVEPRRAAELMQDVAHGTSKRAAEASYQWLHLLAYAGAWEKIASERELFLTKIKDEKRGVPYFYLGMIAFEQKRYSEALADLLEALKHEIAEPHDQALLEALLTCAKELNRLELFEQTYAELSARYPEVAPEATLLRASVYEDSALYDEMIERFPMHPMAERARLEKMRLCIEAKQWAEAHGEVRRYLERYPRSERREEMLKLAIDLSSKQEAAELLVVDLEQAFSERLFSGQERAAMQELLAKTYLELDQVHAALGLLHEMDTPDPLLFVTAYVKEGSAPEKVIRFGERALELYPEQSRLHLHLFNAYLEQVKKSPNPEMTARAADHLLAVIEAFPVSIENQLWLAHHLTTCRDKRAIPLLERVLASKENVHRFTDEAIVLARLYLRAHTPEKVEPLLSMLEQCGAAQLVRAEALSEREKTADAEAILVRLEGSEKPSIAYGAALQLARLRFAIEPQKSLQTLHELKQRKILASEPIHLEAALDHAELSASLMPPAKQLKQKLASLLEMRKEFTARGDIWSKDYHESRQLMPEKELVYQAYMRYLDAEIAHLEAQQRKDPKKAEAARALFSSVAGGEYAVSKYIVERAQKRLYEE